MRPRREQHDGQIRMAVADRPEQRRALLARGRIGAEIHVLHDEVHALAFERGEPFLGRRCAQRADLAQVEQHVERRHHGRVVVDHEYGAHRRILAESAAHWLLGCSSAPFGCRISTFSRPGEGGAKRRTTIRRSATRSFIYLLAQRSATCLPFCAAIHASVRASSTSSGRAPPFSISSWKARMSNLSPSSFFARSRSARNLSWPILYESACAGNAM